MSLRTGDHLTLHSPIDVHTHLREPGGEAQETIASGTLAGLHGGYQMLSDMPNNAVPYQTWTPERVDEKGRIIRSDAYIDVGVYAGVDFTNPNYSQLPRIVRHILGSKFYMGFTTNNSAELTLDSVRDYADAYIQTNRQAAVEKPILLHAREGVGAETADYIASQNFPVHWCHVSTEAEATMAGALTRKHPGLFTAGVTPHHLTMTERNADVQQGWNGARMMPPLGKEVDADALLDAYNREDIQILETDHAPHTLAKKMEAEDENPTGEIGQNCTTCFGVGGLEFILPVMTALVRRGLTTMERVEDSMYDQPLRMLRLGHLAGTVLSAITTLEIGSRIITTEDFAGKSRNTPYINWTAGAKIVEVKRGSQVLYDGENVGPQGEARFVHQKILTEEMR